MDRNVSDHPAALVFGGSRGIGAAAVTRLAADGYSVAFTYATSTVKAKELVCVVSSGTEYRGGDFTFPGR